jgi:hypothetical protein
MRRPSLSWCLVAVPALAYSAPGCGEDRLCAPGALSACFLPDGALGAQQCNGDGLGYGLQKGQGVTTGDVVGRVVLWNDIPRLHNIEFPDDPWTECPTDSKDFDCGR